MRLMSMEQGPKSTQTALSYPPQVALAVTLQGARRGPGQFGRFYLPGPNMALQADARMSKAHQQTANEFVRTFLLACRDAYAIPSSPDVVDANPVNVSSLGNGTAGTIQIIERAGVGRVFDTVRRRRRQLGEDRVLINL